MHIDVCGRNERATYEDPSELDMETRLVHTSCERWKVVGPERLRRAPLPPPPSTRHAQHATFSTRQTLMPIIILYHCICQKSRAQWFSNTRCVWWYSKGVRSCCIRNFCHKIYINYVQHVFRMDLIVIFKISNNFNLF